MRRAVCVANPAHILPRTPRGCVAWQACECLLRYTYPRCRLFTYLSNTGHNIGSVAEELSETSDSTPLLPDLSDNRIRHPRPLKDRSKWERSHHPQVGVGTKEPRPTHRLRRHQHSFRPYREHLKAKLGYDPLEEPTRGEDPYQLVDSIRQGDFHEILSSVSRATDDHDYFSSIPLALWNSMLSAVEPRKWMLEPVRLPAGRTTVSPTKKTPQTARREAAIASVILQLYSYRSKAATPIELADYRRFLEHAAQLGHRRMAERFFKDMKSRGIRPDITSYNDLMQAIAFDQSRSLAGQQNPAETGLEVLPGHSMEVEAILRHMQDNDDVQPNMKSYCILIHSLSRDNHMVACRRVLSKLFNVDTTALMSGQAVEHVSSINPSSPLYPDQALLSTIALSFGSRGHIAGAIRLVNFIAHHYNIPVKRNVWSTLLHWLWYFSRNERARLRDTEQLESAGPLKQFTQLYAFARDHSNLAPTVEMLDYIHKSTLGDSMQGTDVYMTPILRGKTQVSAEKRSYYPGKARSHSLRRLMPGRVTQAKPSPRLDLMLLRSRISVGIHEIFLRNWARNVLEKGIPDSHRPSPEEAFKLSEWRVRGVPNFVLKWNRFLRRKVRYQVDTGIVTLSLPLQSTENGNPRLSKRYFYKRTVGVKTVEGRTHANSRRALRRRVLYGQISRNLQSDAN